MNGTLGNGVNGSLGNGVDGTLFFSSGDNHAVRSVLSQEGPLAC